MKFMSLALAAALLSSLTAAFAGGDNPCRADAETLCPDLKPGDGKWWPCLKEHKDELSDACKAKIQEKKGAKQVIDDACRAEAEKACPDMKPGDGKFLPCIKQHRDDLSEGCRNKIENMMRGKGGKDDACRADAEKLCAGLKPGDGKFGNCMKEHKDDLSDACKAKISGMLEAKNDDDKPCKAEAENLCPGMKPGDGKFGPCMKEHKDDLSEGCRNKIARHMEGRKKAKVEENATEADKNLEEGSRGDNQGDHQDNQ